MEELSFELENIGDEELDHKPSQKYCSQLNKHRRVFIFLVAFIFILCLITVSVVTTLSVVLTRYHVPDPPKYFDANDILESLEFQISLRPKEDWTDRDTMIDLWIDRMNEHSQLLTVSRDTAIEDVYEQHHFSTYGHKRCSTGNDFKTRIRKYALSGKTTIDIKGGEDPESKEDSCNLAFWPAEAYYNQSRQKCEEDIHPCFSKFTRGTAVTVPNDTKFETCGDLKKIFPDAFYNVDDHNKNNEIKKNGAGNWYKYQWKGVAGENINYEIQFTIEYFDSVSSVLQGNLPIVEGEWSMRLWSDHGTKWDLDAMNDLETLFYQLVLDFDDYEDHFDCANAFLNGDNYVGIDLSEHSEFLSN